MSELADFLAARGYLRVPLTRSGVGHFHTAGTLNGRPVEVLVDTGAACTVVGMSVVRALGLQAEWVNNEGGGAGGALDQYMIGGAELRIGADTPRRQRAVDHIQAAFPPSRLIAPLPQLFDQAGRLFRILYGDGSGLQDRLGPVNDLLIALTAR